MPPILRGIVAVHRRRCDSRIGEDIERNAELFVDLETFRGLGIIHET